MPTVWSYHVLLKNDDKRQMNGVIVVVVVVGKNWYEYKSRI